MCSNGLCSNLLSIALNMVSEYGVERIGGYSCSGYSLPVP